MADDDPAAGLIADAVRARVKLSRYALADPWTYACLLVETSLLCEARHVNFEIGAYELTVRFDGASFAQPGPSRRELGRDRRPGRGQYARR